GRTLGHRSPVVGEKARHETIGVGLGCEDGNGSFVGFWALAVAHSTLDWIRHDKRSRGRRDRDRRRFATVRGTLMDRGREYQIMSLAVETPPAPSLESGIDADAYDDADVGGDEYRRAELEEFLETGAWDDAFSQWADGTGMTEAEFAIVRDLDLLE